MPVQYSGDGSQAAITANILTQSKITEFANSVDLDEVAHNEPPHLNLHCLPSCL